MQALVAHQFKPGIRTPKVMIGILPIIANTSEIGCTHPSKSGLYKGIHELHCIMYTRQMVENGNASADLSAAGCIKIWAILTASQLDGA